MLSGIWPEHWADMSSDRTAVQQAGVARGRALEQTIFLSPFLGYSSSAVGDVAVGAVWAGAVMVTSEA